MLTGILRTIILFLVTAIVVRLMGKRQLAQLQPYEVVITLMISDLATQPMSDVELPLMSGVVSIVTLLLMHSVFTALAYVSIPLRGLICGRPSVLVRDGKICEKEMSRLCFDLSDLLEGIRSQGVLSLQETGSVILETNGTLSVFPSAENRPATRGELGLPKVYDGIPLTLILDGKMQDRVLRIANVDAGWLRRTLQAHGIKRDRDVLIAALDTQGALLVQEKGDAGRLINIENAIDSQKVRW